MNNRMDNPPSKPLHSSVLLIGILIGSYVCLMTNWQLEALRLTSAFGNALVLLVAQVLPCIALVMALRHMKGRRRWTCPGRRRG